MTEHWYEYLPAAWYTPEARWYVFSSVVLLMLLAFALGYWAGKKSK